MKLRRGLSFCRSCNQCDSSGWIKKFGKPTKLIVVPSDRRLPADVSPKPTIFLPSIAEINLHNAGTYLCLLENFFPDVIRVYWKEKNGNRILESQQGNIMKTNDTYMKFSWLTVTGSSINEEHMCIVQHEKNRGEVDQEILFPSVIKVLLSIVATIDSTKALLKDKSIVTAIDSTKSSPKEESVVTAIDSTTSSPKEESVVTATDSTTSSPKEESEVTAINSTKACLKDESNTLQLQLTSTSACYAYLLLLLMSAVYFAIIAFCLFRRTVVCGNGKSS